MPKKPTYIPPPPAEILDDMRVSHLAQRIFFKMWCLSQSTSENQASTICCLPISGTNGLAKKWGLSIGNISRTYKCLRDLGYILRIENKKQSNVARYRLYSNPTENPFYDPVTGQVKLPPKAVSHPPS